MSYQAVLKKLRKEMRRDINKKYADYAAYLAEMGFWERFWILARLLFRRRVA
jgi:hypothetical protein